VVGPVPEPFVAGYGRAENFSGSESAMTEQEHQAQRHLVELSLLLCPAGGRHQPKGHEAKDADEHVHGG
jgi:hypothetical protein